MAVLAADLAAGQGTPDAGRDAAETALQHAVAGPFALEEALARRLLGRCALADGDPGAALTHLRAALAVQIEHGAALDAARTRVLLAETLVCATEAGSTPDEARALLVEARSQFTTSGAALDLTRVEHLAAAWAAR
jgi:hypothetical protein